MSETSPEPQGRHAFRNPQDELEYLREKAAYWEDRAASLAAQKEALQFKNNALEQRLGEVGVSLTKATVQSVQETRITERQHDTKTGLLNTEGIELAVAAAQEARERDGVPRVLLFLDAKNFGGVNNHPELGHDKADELIELLPTAMERVLRTGLPDEREPQKRVEQRRAIKPGQAHEVDMIGRVGGDEYVVIAAFDSNEKNLSVEQRMEIIGTRLEAAVETMVANHEFARQLRELGFGIYVGYAEIRPGVDVKVLKREANEVMVERKRLEKEARAKKAVELARQQGQSPEIGQPESKTAAALEAMKRAQPLQPGDDTSRGGGGRNPHTLYLGPDLGR